MRARITLTHHVWCHCKTVHVHIAIDWQYILYILTCAIVRPGIYNITCTCVTELEMLYIARQMDSLLAGLGLFTDVVVPPVRKRNATASLNVYPLITGATPLLEGCTRYMYITSRRHTHTSWPGVHLGEGKGGYLHPPLIICHPPWSFSEPLFT